MAFKERKVSDEKSSSQNQLKKALSRYSLICVFFLSAPVTTTKSKCSKFKAGVHTFWSLLAIFVTTWASFEEYINANLTVPDVQKFLHITEYAVNVIIVLATPWVSYRKRRFYGRASDQVQAIDKELSQIVGGLSYKAFIKFFNVYLTLLMVFAGATSSIVFCFEGFRFVGFLRGCAVYLVPNLVNSFQLGQYYCVLLFIRERMRSIITFTEKLNFESKDSSENLTSLRVVFSKLEYLHFKVNEKASVITGITFMSVFLIVSNQLFVFYNDIAETKIRKWDLSLFSWVWLCLHFGKVLCLYYFNSQIIKARISLVEVLNHHDHVTSDEYSVSFRLCLVNRSYAKSLQITRFSLQMMMDRRPYSSGIVELNMQDIKLVGTDRLFGLFLKIHFTYFQFVMNISVYVIFLIQYDLILKTFNTVTASQKELLI